MATPVFLPGWPGKVSFELSGAMAYTDINVTGWDWNESNDIQETTHSGSGGVEEYIPGLTRGEGQFSATLDSANFYNATAPGITSGAVGVIKKYVSASKFYGVPVIIRSLPVKSVVNGKVTYDCQYKLNGAAGSYVRPS